MFWSRCVEPRISQTFKSFISVMLSTYKKNTRTKAHQMLLDPNQASKCMDTVVMSRNYFTF